MNNHNLFHYGSQQENAETYVSKKLVAGTGFEPATFWLWAKRATKLLYPATKTTNSHTLLLVAYQATTTVQDLNLPLRNRFTTD